VGQAVHYGYMNLFGTDNATDSMKITAGVNNVFDKLYADPTKGVNRAMGSSGNFCLV
jgi:outer membrane receptor for ferrienterochelin and colicin